MKGRLILSFLILISYFTAMPITQAKSKGISAELLFGKAEVSAMTMSPDGKYLAVVIPQENTDLINILDLDTKKPTYSFKMGNDKYMGRFRWANNTRLLIEPAIKGGFREQLYLTQKLQAINFDGSKNRHIYGYQSNFSSSIAGRRLNRRRTVGYSTKNCG
ncbi:hypothetical protein [Aliikangiella maris]|uniref:S9 family peptidase n=2 Tax=Aliikangiella maris TaxID=3162458 RepID=A0ABV3MLC3_9GAMM